MKLSTAQKAILTALMQGATLKDHRNLDGEKFYQLHNLDGTTSVVEASVVARLEKRKLLDSNKKFPAATYLLTDKGKTIAASLTSTDYNPLSAKNFGS